MLAQAFLSPAKLGISPVEFSALVTFLGMAERGEIKDAPKFRILPLPPQAPVQLFSMGLTAAETDCGTVGCIRGWGQSISGKHLFEFALGQKIGPLFYPHNSGIFANVAQAACATRNFLTYGEPRWDEVMSR